MTSSTIAQLQQMLINLGFLAPNNATGFFGPLTQAAVLAFQKTNGLPEDEDWTTLKKFEFRDKIDFLQPEYKKLDNKTFELIYLEGFDGPYLMWNSKERIWKKGYPTFLKRSPE